MALIIACRFMLKHKLGKGHFYSRKLAQCLWSIRMKATDTTIERPNTEADKMENKTGTEVDVVRKNPYAGMSAGEKVKEAGKDFTFMGISLAALGMLGAMFYYVGRELFSGDSSNGVYTKAFKRCAKDEEVIIALGEPIKAYGEETRRGRRRHVSHIVFEQDGKTHMRMKFHIQGPDKRADVNLEVVKDDSGHYQYRYLFVQIEQFPYKTIILEDNR